MKPEGEINLLIQALQRLYSRIASFILEKRMGSYRGEAGSVADHRLSTLLSDHIDRLAESRPANGVKAQGKAPEHKVHTATDKQRLNLSLGQRQSEHQVSIMSRALSGLGRYFRSKQTESVLDPEMSKKLKKSTWTHIHTAIRLARQGDARTAKLHLDIASQALQEAGHYMPKEEHIAFTVEIEEKLGEITAQGMDSDLST
jgi:hypothetical protein